MNQSVNQTFNQSINQKIFTLDASSGKCNATVWSPSVRQSVPSAYSLWLTRGQHATRTAYILARQ